AMRSDANRLRHAMNELHKVTSRVQDLYFIWADGVREGAEARMGASDTDAVINDPHYARVLDNSPHRLALAVQEWCAQAVAELDAWRPAATADSRADVEARAAHGDAGHVPNLDRADGTSPEQDRAWQDQHYVIEGGDL